MHAEMENCVKSLRQMGYKTFMDFMKIFFALTNLKNMDNVLEWMRNKNAWFYCLELSVNKTIAGEKF